MGIGSFKMNIEISSALGSYFLNVEMSRPSVSIPIEHYTTMLKGKWLTDSLMTK